MYLSKKNFFVTIDFCKKIQAHSAITIKESPNPFLRKMGLTGQISQPIRGQQRFSGRSDFCLNLV